MAVHWINSLAGVWGCRRGCDRMAGVAHRVTACYDCLLEDLDADAAARRVFERLFVRDGEVVLLETVKRGTESAEVRKQVC